MKRFYSLLLMVFLLFSFSSHAEYDLSGMTNEELAQLIEEAQNQLNRNQLLEEDEMVQKAVEVLLDYWTQEYNDEDKEEWYEQSDGYFEIIHTRVVYLRDSETAYGLNAAKLKDMFPDSYAIVEFIILTDYYCSAPYYYESGMLGGSNIIVHNDGTMEAIFRLLDSIRSRTYDTDFSGIIKSISNLGDKYNGVYHLIEK